MKIARNARAFLEKRAPVWEGAVKQSEEGRSLMLELFSNQGGT